MTELMERKAFVTRWRKMLKLQAKRRCRPIWSQDALRTSRTVRRALCTCRESVRDTAQRSPRTRRKLPNG